MKKNKSLYIIILCLLSISLQAQIASYPHIEGFEGAMSWTNTTGDLLDWAIRSGSTPSGGTGPSSAYSGTNYIYLEASSPNYPSKTAYLVSSVYNLQSYTTADISFRYHMYGATMGSLRLESSTNGGVSWSTFWSISGDQGNSWKSITRSIDHLCGNNVLFRLVGTTGSSYTGDIALDELKVSTGLIAVPQGPSTDKNFVLAKAPLSTSGLNGEVLETIAYFDGLGREDQTIQIGASPQGNDVVQAIDYDRLSRQSKKYLPYTIGIKSGQYKLNELLEGNWTDHYGSLDDAYAFSETKYDQSPLNRTIEKSKPGYDWRIANGHTTKLEYSTNTGSEVIKFDVNNITKSSNGYHAANELAKKTVKNENWISGKANTTEEFIDKQGRVILTRSWLDDVTSVNTYNVFDKFGRIRYVLTPKVFESGSNSVSSTELSQLCYQYIYDGKGRVETKILPGTDPTYMLYDKKDRLVMTRDGELANAGQWKYTLYDNLNRNIESGLCTAGTFGSLKSTVNNSLNYIPPNRSPVTYTYYDDYTHCSNWGYDHIERSGFSENVKIDGVVGKVTASETKNLETGNWIKEVFYYDKYSRIIQSYRENDLGGYDRMTNLFDFSGNITKSEQYHKRLSSSSPIIITKRYLYDHANRPTKKYHKIGSQSEVLMVENKYNEIGQLEEKNIHNNIQSIDYRYNINGWITSINNANLSNDGSLNNDTEDLFGMELAYQKTISGLSGSGNIKYDGSISALKWKSSSHSNIQGYLYYYDALNRLKKADYKYNSGSWVNSSAYDVYGSSSYGNMIGYDLNGNIKSLFRNNSSGSSIDQLVYTYNGNQLKSVEDAANSSNGFREVAHIATEYIFDDNGNLINDINRGHSIQYNILNLPKNLNSGTLKYEYSATGEKLRKVASGTTTDYIVNFVYTNNSLAYILTNEGRIVKSGSIYLYEYNLKDHLGNTRVSFQVNGSTPTVLQYQDYYPFGMAMNTIQNDNRYLYNGKELQDDIVNGDNLDWYDYDTRMYDAQLARFHTVDILSDDYVHRSPFIYAENNPVNMIDYKGMMGFDQDEGEDKRQKSNELLGQQQVEENGTNSVTIYGLGGRPLTISTSGSDMNLKGVVIATYYVPNSSGGFDQIDITDEGEIIITGSNANEDCDRNANESDVMKSDLDIKNFFGSEFEVTTKNERTGKAMMEIFNPDFVSFAFILAYIPGAKITPKGYGFKGLGLKGSLNFSSKAAAHMADKGRHVPMKLLRDVITKGRGHADPRGSRALMYYSRIVRQGKVYNLEVLYDRATNSVWHFEYTRRAIGTLSRIPKL